MHGVNNDELITMWQKSVGLYIVESRERTLHIYGLFANSSKVIGSSRKHLERKVIDVGRWSLVCLIDWQLTQWNVGIKSVRHRRTHYCWGLTSKWNCRMIFKFQLCEIKFGQLYVKRYLIGDEFEVKNWTITANAFNDLTFALFNPEPIRNDRIEVYSKRKNDNNNNKCFVSEMCATEWTVDHWTCSLCFSACLIFSVIGIFQLVNKKITCSACNRRTKRMFSLY